MKKTKPAAIPAKKMVLIVDDHPVLREGLSQIINLQPDLAVCAEADNPARAMAAIARAKPDVVLVDISLEQSSGLELIKDIHTLHPHLPMLALSMHDESLYAERALRAGARGYIMKRMPTPQVMAAIRTVLTGGFALSEAISARILGSMIHSDAGGRSPVEALADRELEVFELLGRGLSTRAIAGQLHLSIKTVSAHRESIKKKLGLRSAAELVRHAIHWAKEQHVD